MVEFGELAQNRGRLLLVLADGTGKSFSARRPHNLLVMDDVLDHQRTEIRHQLQTQSLPEPDTDKNSPQNRLEKRLASHCHFAYFSWHKFSI